MGSQQIHISPFLYSSLTYRQSCIPISHRSQYLIGLLSLPTIYQCEQSLQYSAVVLFLRDTISVHVSSSIPVSFISSLFLSTNCIACFRNFLFSSSDFPTLCIFFLISSIT